MFGASRKPYTAVTVQVERLTSEQYDENDFSGIVDLIEVIRLQSSGPTEATRAIRKKLKYGNVHRQLRALTILDGLIQNAGPRFLRVFADEPLLLRLRVAATEPMSDVAVKEKCNVLFGQWAASNRNTQGMEGIVGLSRELPRHRKSKPQQQFKVLKETEAEAEAEDEAAGGSPPGPSAPPLVSTSSSSRPVTLSAGPNLVSQKSSSRTSKKDKSRSKPFNLEKEKPQLLQTIASSSVASTNLMNSLKLIDRENKQVSDDPEVMNRFETCKTLRRQILRYIQHVESEQWLGSLLHANDELVTALTTFEVLDKNVEEDSDSDGDDNEWDADDNASRMAMKSPGPDAAINTTTTDSLAGLKLGGADDYPLPSKPPRPGMSVPMPPAPAFGNAKGKAIDDDGDEEDENDPFADSNAVATPHVEASGLTWREV